MVVFDREKVDEDEEGQTLVVVESCRKKLSVAVEGKDREARMGRGGACNERICNCCSGVDVDVGWKPEDGDSGGRAWT